MLILKNHTLDDFSVWKCKTLIRMLIQKQIPPERALNNYPRRIYEQAKKEVLDITNKNGSD